MPDLDDAQEPVQASDRAAFADPGMSHFGEIGSARMGMDNMVGFGENLPELRGRRKLQTYREMRENSATVGAIIMAIKMIIRSVPWNSELPEDAEEDDSEANRGRSFLTSCMSDMSSPWAEFIDDSLDAVWAGFAAPEIVYKQRLGENPGEDQADSDYDDGLIGWRKVAYRDPEAVTRWDLDHNGGIKGYYHQVEGDAEVYIPIQKAILFRASRKGNHPEGYSWLHNSVVSYIYMKKHQWLEAVGVERAGLGLPTIRLPLGANTTAGSQDILRAQNLVSSVRRDAYAGVVIPPPIGPAEHQKWVFELMSTSSSGSEATTDVIIRRYALEIASSVLAHFILLIMQPKGSYSLSKDQRDLWQLGMSGLTHTWAELINRFMVKPLFRLNRSAFPDHTKWPRIVPGDVAQHDIEKIQDYITNMITAGALHISDDDRDRIRAMVGFPPETKADKQEREEAEAKKEAEAKERMEALKQGQQEDSNQDPDDEPKPPARKPAGLTMSMAEDRIGKPIDEWTPEDFWVAAMEAEQRS